MMDHDEVYYESRETEDKKTLFGREMREKYFLFKKGYINLNQGAYGAYPRPVREALRLHQDEAESLPDEFVRHTYPSRINGIRKAISEMLNAAHDEIVLVPNATTALNTVLRNLQFKKGDKIVYFSTIYGAIEKTLQYLVESTPLQMVEVKHTLPISDDELIAQFQKTLDEHNTDGTVKVAIFDTIVSMPGVRTPFERLTEMCRNNNVLSLIDGAHGIGHIQLDLGSFQPDFLVTNCHKWLFVPRSCAVFYVPYRNQHLMRSSLPTSHGFAPLRMTDSKRAIHNPMPSSETANPFTVQFEYTGTIDTGPSLCIPAALAFRNHICGGEEKIREYCVDLARRGEELISRILGCETLQVPTGNRVNFANVRLPLLVGSSTNLHSKLEGHGFVAVEHISTVTNFFNKKFIEDFNTYIAICFWDGAWWARFSAEIYLDLDDFEYGARVLKQLCERVGHAGENKPMELEIMKKARSTMLE